MEIVSTKRGLRQMRDLITQKLKVLEDGDTLVINHFGPVCSQFKFNIISEEEMKIEMSKV
jgi:hypothetical protein